MMLTKNPPRTTRERHRQMEGRGSALLVALHPRAMNLNVYLQT